MAYRKRTRVTRRRSGYRSGGRSRYTGQRRRVSRRRVGSGAGRAVRLVIETRPSSGVARPDDLPPSMIGLKTAPGPRRARF